MPNRHGPREANYAMTLTLDLTSDLERRLIDEAGRHGIPPNQYVVDVLKQHLPADERRGQCLALLQSWMDSEDPKEQADQSETFGYLLQALDEDRPTQRKLFPPNMKGISW